MSTSAEQINELIGGYTDLKAYFEAQRDDWEARIAAAEASMDAFIAGHYEQGTFSPALTFGNESEGITYASQHGFYFKTGQVVHVTGRIRLTSKGTSVGNAKLIGLPLSYGLMTGYLNRHFLVAGGDTGVWTGLKTDAWPEASLHKFDTGARVPVTDADFGDTTYITFQLSYDTNA